MSRPNLSPRPTSSPRLNLNQPTHHPPVLAMSNRISEAGSKFPFHLTLTASFLGSATVRAEGDGTPKGVDKSSSGTNTSPSRVSSLNLTSDLAAAPVWNLVASISSLAALWILSPQSTRRFGLTLRHLPVPKFVLDLERRRTQAC